jgi:hypothetical protein
MLVAGKEKRITSKMTYFDRFVTNTLNGLQQGWATLFGSRATLETKFVYAGQYKNPMGLFDFIFKRKWVFGCPFSKKKHFKRHF